MTGSFRGSSGLRCAGLGLRTLGLRAHPGDQIGHVVALALLELARWAELAAPGRERGVVLRGRHGGAELRAIALGSRKAGGHEQDRVPDAADRHLSAALRAP